jgi:surface antigen
VNWSSSPSGIVTVSALGLATSSAVGAATITATVGSVHGAAPLTVSPAALVTIDVSSTSSSFPLGTTQQLFATGHFTDGHTGDITNTVTWASASPQIVSITSKGVAAALAAGTATISASAPGVAASMLSGKAVLAVSAAQLTSINISPTKPVIPLGSQQSLVAIGAFTDGSNQDLTQTVTWTVDKPDVASISLGGVATAQKVGTTSVRSSLQGVSGAAMLTVQPMASVGYFTKPATNQDTAVRITNPAITGKNLCAMLYVFDQDQQMTECCGCQISQDGLRTLSVNKDLLSNPLTGVQSLSGTIMLVPADYASNTSCNASAIAPSGKALAWSTHVQNVSSSVPTVTEDAFSATPLSDTQSNALQAQCYCVQQLGRGHGICSCGTGR